VLEHQTARNAATCHAALVAIATKGSSGIDISGRYTQAEPSFLGGKLASVKKEEHKKELAKFVQINKKFDMFCEVQSY